MSEQEYPKEFLEMLQSLKSKRARWVAQYILDNGSVTTEDIRNQGYNDPYRPTMDLRDAGVPLDEYKVRNSQGRLISAYKFGDITKLTEGRQTGRKPFPKAFKQKLIETYGARCSICLNQLDERYLQIDHRVPYQVGGDSSGQRQVEDYMLLCGSCNRSKSWSCENCENFRSLKDVTLCKTCYWADPQFYKHVALQQSRRLDITWTREEIQSYDRLRSLAEAQGLTVGDYIKILLR